MASENISFDNIPSSIRKPGKYFEFNTRLAVRTLPQNRQKLLIVGQRIEHAIEDEVHYGAGLDDVTVAGTFTGTVDRRFLIEIDAADTPDTFKWSKDGGNTWEAETVAITGAAQALTEGITIAFAATTGHTLGDQWLFYVYREPIVAEKVPTDIWSDIEAAEKFGYGSQVHIMAKAAIDANAYVALSICALDDSGAGVKATGTVTIDATAIASGTFTLCIGNEKVEILAAKDDTAAEIAAALSEQIMQQNSLPVRAKVDATTDSKVNVEAKNAGTVGNQIDLEYECTNEATTATIVDMASGSGDPDIDDALDEVFSEDYNIIATAWNDSDSLGDLKDHLDSVSGPLEQRPATGVYGYDGTIAACTTLAALINSGRELCAFLEGTRSLPIELAAAMASILAWEEDPARPLNTLELKKIHAPTIDDRFTRTEQESLLYNGVTPLEVGPGEAVQIVRAISTYILDPQGVEDISLLDITTIRTLDYVRKALRERIALRFPREKLNSKTPKKVKSEIVDVLKKLEQLEIVEEVEANIDGIVVERDLQDPNRLDAKIPTDVVNGLHVFAARIDLLL